MSRRTIPTGLPQLDALGRVTAKSLKAGHIQKTNDPEIYIFWEDGQYHVTGISAYVGYGEYVRNRRPQVSMRVTVHTRSLKDAQRVVVGHTYLYHYRTWQAAYAPEAIAAK